MKTLLVAASFAVLTTASNAADDATIPAQIRGTWCNIGTIDNHGAKVLVFKRANSCGDNILHVYTAQGRFSNFGTTSETCKAESVESNDRAGWNIVFMCNDFRIEQFLYPMTRNRLGLMTTGISENKPK